MRWQNPNIRFKCKSAVISFVIGCTLWAFGNNPIYSQSIEVNGSLQLHLEILIGNQNQSAKLGLFGYATANYNDIALEAGASLFSRQLLKRHTIKNHGLAFGYEAFALLGLGQNNNLLGSSLSNVNNSIIVNPKGKSGFGGLGFGLEKEYLPNDLKEYSPRRGSILMRFSNANHSLQVGFLNDFRFGKLIRGQGTDYAATGTLKISYSEFQLDGSIYQIGLGLELFTPKSDFSRSPTNSINSDDGRKNVWYVLPPFKDLFYSNLYGFGTFQDDFYSFHGKIGLNSQKMGAYVQNILHDGIGLNPRFPWDVRASDKLFIEFSGIVLETLGDGK